MRDFSIIYELTKFPVRCITNVFYKKVTLWHPEHFPSKGPVLICSNHTNAFMDASLISCRVKRQLFSLARGDVFKGKLASWILKQYKINPIFRLLEGAEHLHKNEQAFNRSYEILERKNPLVIYPEGICIQEKRLRKLKKGAARIAFGVEDRNDFKLGLFILPVGLNYSDAKKYRSTFHVNFGKPFHLSQFKDLYRQDKVKAINEFTRYLEGEMAKLVVIVEDKANDEWYEQVLVLCKADLLRKHGWRDDDLHHDFLACRKIAEKLNGFSKNHPRKTEELRLLSGAYFDKLARYRLRDHLLKNNVVNKNGLKDALLLTLGFPFHVIGLLLNYIPYKVAHTAANRIAKNVEFHASVNILVGWLGWTFYCLIQLLVVAVFLRSWSFLFLAVAVIPLSGLYSVHFYPFMKKTFGRWRLVRLSKNNRSEYDQLLSMRKHLLDELQALRINE